MSNWMAWHFGGVDVFDLFCFFFFCSSFCWTWTNKKYVLIKKICFLKQIHNSYCSATSKVICVRHFGWRDGRVYRVSKQIFLWHVIPSGCKSWPHCRVMVVIECQSTVMSLLTLLGRDTRGSRYRNTMDGVDWPLLQVFPATGPRNSNDSEV